MGYVGSRMRRLEDPRLLAGVGHFADDEERPGQLWMRVVRSPVAHAVLGAVDVGHALKLSGVRTVLTSADISVPPIPVRVSPDPGDLSAYLQPVLATARRINPRTGNADTVIDHHERPCRLPGVLSHDFRVLTPIPVPWR